MKYIILFAAILSICLLNLVLEDFLNPEGVAQLLIWFSYCLLSGAAVGWCAAALSLRLEGRQATKRLDKVRNRRIEQWNRLDHD